MKQGDKVDAYFSPHDYTSLREEAKEYLGKRMEFQALFIIDGGLYAGQWAMRPVKEIMGWVPFSDLDVLRCEELLLCPFCGNTPIMESEDVPYPDETPKKGFVFERSHRVICECGVTTGWHIRKGSFNRAADSWNKRTS